MLWRFVLCAYVLGYGGECLGCVWAVDVCLEGSWRVVEEGDCCVMKTCLFVYF